MTSLFVQCRRNSGSFNLWRWKKGIMIIKNPVFNSIFFFFSRKFSFIFVSYSSLVSYSSYHPILYGWRPIHNFILLNFFVNICFLLCITTTNNKQQPKKNHTIFNRTTAVADKLWHEELISYELKILIRPRSNYSCAAFSSFHRLPVVESLAFDLCWLKKKHCSDLFFFNGFRLTRKLPKIK